MYWVQEMKSRNIDPDDQYLSSTAIQRPIDSTDILKILFDSMETSSKAADPRTR
jgi:hypothetical protein